MPAWLGAAVDYIARWIEFQMRQHERPGCVIAVAHKGRVVLDEAFGYADLAKRVRMTPRHRFRVASHFKTYCAAAVMKLREDGRPRLDDPAGRYVAGLHPTLGRVTLGQLLSHRAGGGARRFGRRAVRRPATLPRRARAASRAPRAAHAAAKHALQVLEPRLSPRLPLASGHSSRLPLGRRAAIGGEYSTRAITSIERYYGLGTMSGRFGTWRWFGHSGGLQGYITRTAVLRETDVAVGVLRAFARHGAPAPTARKWTGRWWTLWNPIDLVPVGGKVLVARPDWPNPFLDASEIAPRGRSEDHIALAGGYASHAEPARLERGRRGEILEVHLGGSRYRSEKRVAREMAARYRVAKHA